MIISLYPMLFTELSYTGTLIPDTQYIFWTPLSTCLWPFIPHNWPINQQLALLEVTPFIVYVYNVYVYIYTFPY